MYYSVLLLGLLFPQQLLTLVAQNLARLRSAVNAKPPRRAVNVQDNRYQVLLADETGGELSADLSAVKRPIAVGCVMPCHDVPQL